jgi:glycosyltransferase involved in cell wall biosynthesis
MRIFFHTPFKPLAHSSPSGDLIIATGLMAYLKRHRHLVHPVKAVRCRWLYWRPWIWPGLIADYRRAVKSIEAAQPQLWITYHSYYKAPDVLGPAVCRKSALPYVIFQGIYATKRRRRIKTWPGFILNQYALRKSQHVFTNKIRDWTNLKRILPEHRLTYVKPGLEVNLFSYQQQTRDKTRQAWKIGNTPAILTAAMFRQDVKTQGLLWLIECLGQLNKTTDDFVLIIAGDGREKSKLVESAAKHLPGRHRFLGKIPRSEMAEFYSAGEIFAFPGINESLGMVYLEAQSCGLPVVAFRNAGVPEVVIHGETGFLTDMFSAQQYMQAIKRLLSNRALRQAMGQKAQRYVRAQHNSDTNYRKMEGILNTIVSAAP